MNLLTDRALQSFDHSTKKISVVYDQDIDLDKYALIKKTSKEIIILSYQNLDKYDLKCTKADYKEKELYFHTQKIEPNSNLFELLYKLTKLLTQERQTLDSVISNTSKNVDTQDLLEWIDKNVPLVLESPQHIERCWKQYCNKTNQNIELSTWMKSFNELYSEHIGNGCFYKKSITQEYDIYADTILRSASSTVVYKNFTQAEVVSE